MDVPYACTCAQSTVSDSRMPAHVFASSGKTSTVSGGNCCPYHLRRGSLGHHCRERLRLVGLLLLLSSGKAGLGVISREKDEGLFKKVYYYGHWEKLGLGMTIIIHQEAEDGCGHCH